MGSFLKDSQIYNTVAAKEGFEQLQKEIMETLGIKQRNKFINRL